MALDLVISIVSNLVCNVISGLFTCYIYDKIKAARLDHS